MCDLVTELDAKAIHVYEFCGTMLSWEYNNPDQAYKILTKGVNHHPTIWYMLYLRGFTALYFLKDYQAAQSDFVRAADLPDCPPFMARLAASTLTQLEDPRLAISFLDERIARTADQSVRKLLNSKTRDATYKIRYGPGGEQMSNEIALEISDISYSYREDWTGKVIKALRPLTLSIAAGECFGFLGHNGAGKTTTIKCILSLIKPNSGSIRIFGLDSSLAKSRAILGYVPEQPYFYDHLTVEEILALYGRLSGLAGVTLFHRIQEVLNRLNIADRRSVRMRSLSKGLTQRVAIAQALLHEPRLLILDEPFSGLDPIGRKEVREVIVEEKDKGTTIFMSSHVLSDVELLCDRASVLAKGQLKGVFNLKDLGSDERYAISIGEREGAEKLSDPSDRKWCN